MTPSTMPLRSTWLLCFDMGSINPGGGHTSSLKIEPVSDVRDLIKFGVEEVAGKSAWVAEGYDCMLVEKFLSSSSNSSPSSRPLPSLFFPEDSRVFRSLCRLYKKTTANTTRTRATKPVVVPAIIAVRRETVSPELDGELMSEVGRDEVTY